MITIPISPEHRFRKLDDLNWSLDFAKERTKDSKPDAKIPFKKGDKYWEPTYYYTSLGSAAADLARILADDPAHADTVDSLQVYADLLRRVSRDLEATINEAIRAVEATKGAKDR